MKSTWLVNGFFDVEMIEKAEWNTVKVYLRGMNNTRALMAEATFKNNDDAYRNAMDNAMDRILGLAHTVQLVRSAKPSST